MIELFKKVNKTINNLEGSQKIKENENPFLEPSMLCIAAMHHLRELDADSIFGITKMAMKSARIRVNGCDGAMFDMDTVPVNFLSAAYINKTEDKEYSDNELEESFVEKYFRPLIECDGKRIDVQTASKNLRNINIIGYCNGVFNINHILKCLENDAVELGYTDEEISNMLSQISVLSIATRAPLNENKATCFDIFDILDTEFEGIHCAYNIPKNLTDNVNIYKRSEELFKMNQTQAGVFVVFDYDHSLKRYISKGISTPVVISRVVSNCLENSINNSTSSEFIPLTTDIMVNRLPRNNNKWN